MINQYHTEVCTLIFDIIKSNISIPINLDITIKTIQMRGYHQFSFSCDNYNNQLYNVTYLFIENKSK
jgi:hypothetical protein